MNIEALLDVLGLRRNETKGVWEPTQVCQHLGIGVAKSGVSRVDRSRHSHETSHYPLPEHTQLIFTTDRPPPPPPLHFAHAAVERGE